MAALYEYGAPPTMEALSSLLEKKAEERGLLHYMATVGWSIGNALYKQRGYTSYKIRTEKLLSESTVQKLRKGEMVSTQNLEILCKLLSCQPGDLIFYTETETQQPDELLELDPLADLDEC